jgi:hypothetical protein
VERLYRLLQSFAQNAAKKSSRWLKVASSANRTLLSIGVFFVVLVISIILAALALIDWWTAPALVIALLGVWVVALGAMQASNPQKYGRSAFSLYGWGLLLIAIGGAWFLYGFGWIYSIAIILIALGGLAIAAAFRRR